MSEGNEVYNAVPWNHNEDNVDKLEFRTQKVMLYGEHPFDFINAGDTFELAKVTERSLCATCGKSRMYYCYTCYVPLDKTRHIIPVLTQKLPCRIDIIKHPREVDGKSTAAHAKVICPSDVRIFTCPDIPNYNDR
jgi:hypothetical protein